MCIKIEDVEAKVRQIWEDEILPKIFDIVDEKNKAFLPTAIAKGIMEAEKHMAMSPATKDEFAKVYRILEDLGDSMGENRKFHEEVRPILEYIKSDMEGRKYVSSKIKGWSATVAGVGVIIGGIIATIKYIIR